MAPRKQGLSTKPEECPKYEGSGPWFTTHADGEMVPRCAAKGMASEKECQVLTLPQLLKQCAEKKSRSPALRVERPCPALKGTEVPPALDLKDWKTWTFADYKSSVDTLAKGCISVGFQPFDTLNIWGFNAPEWMICCIAAGTAGGKCGGLYPTDTDDIAAFKVVHSGGSVIAVDEDSKTQKLVRGLNAREKDPAKHIKAIIAWDFNPADGAKLEIKGCPSVAYMSFAKMLTLGSDLNAELQKRKDAVKPGQCASLIYTSGTTGDPKAVMISHDNIIYCSYTVIAMVKTDVGFAAGPEEDRVVSYLPLSHIAGMMVDIVSPLITAAFFPAAAGCLFARPYDMKANSIKDRLCAARPTLFLGVPLVWEKMADRIRAIGAKGPPTQQKIGTWAKAKMLYYAQNQQAGGSGDSQCCHCLANTILKKVKSGVGFDQLKFALTGAAPIRPDTLEYFGSLGIFINEAYGMSECTGGTTFSLNMAHQWGSCGFENPGTQVRAFIVDGKDLNKKTECPRAPSLDTMEEKYQGELCFRGRHIMMGYLACSDFGLAHRAEIEKKTAETIDAEGWLHSGDKGLITDKGFVKITGRYKELIIGAGGENIAPVPIENSVKRLCDAVNEIMMIGDQRKYNVAFVTLKAVGANGETPGTNKLDAPALKWTSVETIDEAIGDKTMINAVTDAIKKTNNDPTVCANNTFKIQKFTILPTNFSEEGGELTPTKKLKRKNVEKKYASMVDTMYAEDGMYIKWKA